MNIHLFSSPGENGISDIVTAASKYLKGVKHPVVGYLPTASFGNNYLQETKEAFINIAEVALVDTNTKTTSEIKNLLDKTTVLYIPGGNTYVLNKAIHEANMAEDIKQRVQNGLPLVAFSAGTMICGSTIVTTNDMNIPMTSYFNGFSFTTYNFNVHYPSQDGEMRMIRDEKLAEYHYYHDNPLILMEDGSHIFIDNENFIVVQGVCWILEKGKLRSELSEGINLPRI